MVERERPVGAEKRARKRHQPGLGVEKQRRERGIDRLWWTVDSGIASPERECVARERERESMREMGK